MLSIYTHCKYQLQDYSQYILHDLSLVIKRCKGNKKNIIATLFANFFPFLSLKQPFSQALCAIEMEDNQESQNR